MNRNDVRELLKKVEWSGHEQIDNPDLIPHPSIDVEYDTCPYCGGIKPGSIRRHGRVKHYRLVEGHKENCLLARLLKESRK